MTENDAAAVVPPIRIQADEYAGSPFWDAEGHLGEDFEYLHRELGISRRLYEALMRWNHDFELSGSHDLPPLPTALEERLASELHSHLRLPN